MKYFLQGVFYGVFTFILVVFIAESSHQFSPATPIPQASHQPLNEDNQKLNEDDLKKKERELSNESVRLFGE